MIASGHPSGWPADGVHAGLPWVRFCRIVPSIRCTWGRMRRYRGQCHCGATRFEIEAEIDHVRECDCSICRRRGALIFRVPSDAIRFLTPLDRLAVYRWGTNSAADYFCPQCGIMPFRTPSAPTKEESAAGMARFEGWAVNVRCLDGIDLDALPRIRIAGSKLKI